MPIVAFTAGSLGDIIAVSELIFNIIWSLNGGSSLSSIEADLISSLHSLKSAIGFAGGLLQLFNTATGRSNSLPAHIHDGLIECRRDLDRFLDTIQDSRRSLQETSISSLWKRVWWAANGPGEIQKMLDSVERHKLNLALLFGILNASTSQQVQEQVQKPRWNQPRIENIHIPTVYIQDPVGEVFPVSLLHVSSWTQIHEIILTYTKGKHGYDHVMRNAYDLLDQDNNNLKMVQASPLQSHDGAKWEMSMLMESHMDFFALTDIWSRWRLPNPATAADCGGWKPCSRYLASFRPSRGAPRPGQGPDQIVSPNVQHDSDDEDTPDINFFRRIHQALLTIEPRPIQRIFVERLDGLQLDEELKGIPQRIPGTLMEGLGLERSCFQRTTFVKKYGFRFNDSKGRPVDVTPNAAPGSSIPPNRYHHQVSRPEDRNLAMTLRLVL